MVKAIGLLGLVAAAGFMGILKAGDLKERIRLLEEFQKLILTLKSQMNYFREPLVSIFQRTEKTGHTKAFFLLKECLAGLEEKSGEIGQIWDETTRKLYGSTPLTSEDLEVLCHVGSFLGQTDYENQQMQFIYTEERLADQLADARAVYQKKGPMYSRIGFFGGAVVALVLL